MKTIIFTKQGMDDLKKEIDQLVGSREEAVKELKSYREMGDLSENAAYRAAKLKLSRLDSRIKFLNNLLTTAVVREPTNKDSVEIGSQVTLNNQERLTTFTIVGSYESDIAKSKLSYLSPLGKALFGKKIGDIVKINTPSGTKEYQIKKIA